jgi:hypothetical protein
VIGGRQKIRQSQPPLAELIKPFLTERKSRWAKARTTTRVKFFFYFFIFNVLYLFQPYHHQLAKKIDSAVFPFFYTGA